ncbi:MAG TPA: ATP-binding protein [Verrucomicrobiae bacterium]|nr:ATP-binding protein [Verrucomicrobiae bacterium]
MHFLNQIGIDLIFTREYLKAGVLVSLVSVWVLVGLFYYLNRYTKRRYFTIWTAAWLFYALWITLSFGVQGAHDQPLLLMLEQWCVGVSAVFLLWGSASFVGQNLRSALLGWFMAFLLFWSYLGAYYLSKPMEMRIPVFILIAAASGVNAVNFLRYRRHHPYIGATLLTVGFFLWGVYMAGYPFLESDENLTSLALFISAGLQLMLAVSMIIVVLEEVRETHQLMMAQVATGRAERAVLESKVISTEERYLTLFQQAGEAIVITTTDDFRILELNQAAQRLLGIQQSDADHHRLTAFCQVKNAAGSTPESPGQWFDSLCRQRPLHLVRKDGSLLPIEANGSLITLDGRPAFQFFLVEVTERARLEQQLRQAEKLSALGQMISGVAHELNNPLAVVKGYLELILAHHNLPPQTRADLEKVAQESNRAAKLVLNFLSFAREQPAHRQLVNLNDLVQGVVEVRKFDVIVAGTELSLDLDQTLPRVSADPDQAQQLVINLMNNALQAMVDLPRAGRLKISTRSANDRVSLLVEDNGPGVSPDLVQKIFEPFFTTKEVGTGTGLGLSIAHSIMTEHKGRIYYEPSSLGGACFVLEFPAAQAQPGEADTDASEKGSPATRPAEIFSTNCAGRILVLDDEKSIAEMLSEMLGLLGYETTVCNVPAQALEMIKKQEFDLIISDFRMPGLNGEQFFGLATKQRPGLARRIIFLTGDVVNDETLKFLKSTGNPHLAKPFDLAHVRTIVAEVLRANATQEVAEAQLTGPE